MLRVLRHLCIEEEACLRGNLQWPVLSYASEVWGVDEKIGDAAELLHRQFLKHILGVRNSTANVIVLAELGRFPLCFSLVATNFAI